MKAKTSSRLLSTLAVLVVLALSIPPVSTALAEDTGPRNAGTAASIFTTPGAAWTDPSNITTAGDPYASASILAGGLTKHLRATGYGFSIPSGSTIDGIRVIVNRYAGGDNVRDSAVHLMRGISDTGVNKADLVNDWPTSLEAAVYGSPTELWNTTWTPEHINDPGFGVYLSARNNSSETRMAYVDTIQIQVYYTPPGTTTVVDCGAGTVEYGSSLSCTATVTRTAGSGTPGGQVSWATDGGGTFIPGSCELSGTEAAAACSVSYTPNAVGDGSHQITATYAGSASFTGSSGSQDVTVLKATPALSITNSPVVYHGAGYKADVTGSVNGQASNVLYNGAGDLPVDAGIYAVTADFTSYDPNYGDLTSASAGNFVIQQATPTLSVTNSPIIYNGLPHTAEIVPSTTGAVQNIRYDGQLVLPVNPGVYAVTADFMPEDTHNYTSLTAAPAGNFTILAAEPALDLAMSSAEDSYSFAGDVIHYSYVLTNIGDVPLAGPFLIVDGKVSVTCPETTTLALGASLTCTASYTITLADIQAGSVKNTASGYGSYASTEVASNIVELTINYKAMPTLSVSNTPVVYDGLAHAALVESSVEGEVSNILYNGKTELPVDPGEYAVTANFIPEDTSNYASLSAAPAGSFTILAAEPALDLAVTAAETTFMRVGDVIHYSYVLTNIGNVSLQGPFTLTDDKVSVTCPETATLAPEASLTCTASHTITEADIQAGVVTNTAKGFGSYAGEKVLSNEAKLAVIYKPARLFIPLVVSFK